MCLKEIHHHPDDMAPTQDVVLVRSIPVCQQHILTKGFAARVNAVRYQAAEAKVQAFHLRTAGISQLIEGLGGNLIEPCNLAHIGGPRA